MSVQLPFLLNYHTLTISLIDYRWLVFSHNQLTLVPNRLSHLTKIESQGSITVADITVDDIIVGT